MPVGSYAFQGQVSANVKAKTFEKIVASQSGYGITASNHHIQILCDRKDSTGLIWKPKAVAEMQGKRKLTRTYDYGIEAVSLSTSLPAIKNAYLLSLGLNHVYLQRGSDYFNFKANTGTLGTPNGSALAGLHWKFSLDDKERMLEYKWLTTVYPTELEWVANNVGSATTGGAGGSGAPSLDTIDCECCALEDVGITDIEIGCGDDPTFVSVGLFKLGAKLELESGSDDSDTREREVCDHVMAKLEFEMKQTAAADILAAISASHHCCTVKVYAGNGDIFKFNNVNLQNEGEIGDNNSHVKMTMENKFYKNTSESSPDHMDYGIDTEGLAEFTITTCP